MKNWITTFLTLFGILAIHSSKAQDYNDIGRTKEQEFKILKFNGYKTEKIPSNDAAVEMFMAMKQGKTNDYKNIISVNKKTHLVTGVIWNFNIVNFEQIKSFLNDMNPTDSTYSRLENSKGIAQVTIDPFHDGEAMVVWKKKS